MEIPSQQTVILSVTCLGFTHHGHNDILIGATFAAHSPTAIETPRTPPNKSDLEFDCLLNWDNAMRNNHSNRSNRNNSKDGPNLKQEMGRRSI